MSLALVQKCSVASLGKPASTFTASFPACHIFPVGTVPESSVRTETPSATWTASHQRSLQSWLEVAAHWVRWRRRHYFKLRQEIPQLDQWKNFLTVRGMKQTFKGRKDLRRWVPHPHSAGCPCVRSQRKTQQLWSRGGGRSRAPVMAPAPGLGPCGLWIAASHPLI